MHLDYARSFLEVYRLGSMTEAARTLNLTQPAISSHIKILENFLGKPLFLRVGRGLRATPVADELARVISQPLDSVEANLAQLRSHASNIEGTIHIAGPGEFTQYTASHIMGELLALNIKLRIHTGGRDFLIEQLESNKVDLAIMGPPYKSPAIDFAVIAEEQLIPVASPKWATQHLQKPYCPKQLLDKPVIAYDEELPLISRYFKEVLQQTCHQSALVTVPDLRIVLKFLLDGRGYSILPDYMCTELLEKKQLIGLSGDVSNPVNKLYLLWPKIKLRDARVAFVKKYLLNSFMQQR